MLHMIEVKYSANQRDAALAYFQDHGMTHYNADLVIRGLWVCTEQHIAYVLVEASATDEIAAACQSLQTFGEVEHHSVVASDQL